MNEQNYKTPEELFVLADENGEEMNFRLLDVVMLDEREYLVLLPAEGPYIDEVVILQRYVDEDGGESYADPENPDAVQAVYQIFRHHNGCRLSSHNTISQLSRPMNNDLRTPMVLQHRHYSKPICQPPPCQ